MKISPHNSISFKSIPIYDVKLKKENPDGTISELPATFSKLKYHDKEDRKLVNDIRNSWQDTEFAKIICPNFLNGKYHKEDFYVIERKNEEGKKEIYSIAEFTRLWDCVQFLQSNPQNSENGIKGAGEVMLWGIGKKCSRKKDECFYLIPTYQSRPFYEHIGLQKIGGIYTLGTISAKRFLDRIEKKYNFSQKKKSACLETL